jgi:hypothetical protein
MKSADIPLPVLLPLVYAGQFSLTIPSITVAIPRARQHDNLTGLIRVNGTSLHPPSTSTSELLGDHGNPKKNDAFTPGRLGVEFVVDDDAVVPVVVYLVNKHDVASGDGQSTRSTFPIYTRVMAAVAIVVAPALVSFFLPRRSSSSTSTTSSCSRQS